MRRLLPHPLLTSALLALATTATVRAAEAPDADAETEVETRTVYVVELIVYAHQAGLAGREERWPLEPPPWQDAVLPRLRDELEADGDLDHPGHPGAGDASTNPAADPLVPLPPASPPPAVWVARPEQLVLAEPLARLERDPRYDVLLHTAWQQEGLPRDQAFQVIISDVPMGLYFSTDEELADPADLSAPEAESAREAVDPRATEPVPDGMEADKAVVVTMDANANAALMPIVSPFDDPTARMVGLVRVYLERYLHLQLDLIYDTDLVPDLSQLLIPSAVEQAPSATTAGGPKSQPVAIERERQRPRGDRRPEGLGGEFAQQKDDGPQTLHVRLVESRRMRSTEVHYFDHPVIGVIATITPWQISVDPEVEPEVEADITAAGN